MKNNQKIYNSNNYSVSMTNTITPLNLFININPLLYKEYKIVLKTYLKFEKCAYYIAKNKPETITFLDDSVNFSYTFDCKNNNVEYISNDNRPGLYFNDHLFNEISRSNINKENSYFLVKNYIDKYFECMIEGPTKRAYIHFKFNSNPIKKKNYL